ncbi:hypothetical protein BU24DRAFT_183355 [Aaosphaeria arxii CBS 175.79]|uniref:Uncharacterized protein n=1 Tax=Aaosphaeria arxii CBS 175.79 TaxID=1450172 RepID=A0A6A5XTW4_9PLEO|nr:uncharacterized protein BU24DRAFT_183355 [Aaosphaeria arxii CBS 175.79]KAF2015684.1 hypothetical protein BU24DRAFT_183355 [Aaosphaeria arxii CBS 175.79]
MTQSKRSRSEMTTGDEGELPERNHKRAATVYDAVAGRVSQWGFIGSERPSSMLQPLRPDEVLYRASNAPTRYEETDHYFAHTKLRPDQKLPSSELLTALHAYFSEYYERSEEQFNQKIWNSMDETALIALGILMEETAREVLGETGDLAFLEAAGAEDELYEEAEEKRTAKQESQSRQVSSTRETLSRVEAEDDSISSNFASPSLSGDSDLD